MKTVKFHPLIINLDACGDIEFLQQPIAANTQPQRVRITVEMAPLVAAALNRMVKDGLIKDCREVLE